MRPAPVVEKAAASTNTLFFRGMLGAFIGSLLGMGVWYGLAIATNHQFGIVAWGVGALTGFGARVLGRDGSTALGVVSALFAAMAILLGGTLAIHHMIAGEFGGQNMTHERYTENLKDAKAAGDLETDAQIKAFLAKRESGNEADITTEDVEAFKKDELPEIKELASGKLTEKEYSARHHRETAAADGVVSVALWVGSFVGNLLSFWTILWLVFGCASAYKLGADAD